MKERRMQYAAAAAHRAPFVLRGDNLSAATFWHGKLLNQWARDWVKYQTDGHGTYAICGMEDTGTLQSLTWLAKANKLESTACSSAPPRTGPEASYRRHRCRESFRDQGPQYSAYMPSPESGFTA
jgi:hypothetical protein